MQELIGLFKIRGEQARLERQGRPQLAYQQSQATERIRNSRSFEVRIGKQMHSSLPRRQEALPSNWQKLSFKRKSWTVTLKLSDKDVLQQKGTKLQEGLEIDPTSRIWNKSQYDGKQMLTAWKKRLQLEVEEHQLQLLIEQGEAQVQTVDEQLANQLAQPRQETDWNRGHSETLWADDFGSTARWQNRWNKLEAKTQYRQQAAEATREKYVIVWTSFNANYH